MFYKLAIGNVKKSIKDYTIYFLTIMFGVCLFYTFNSMGAQQEMLAISESQKELLKTFNGVIGGISVFVSFILGFLILYANKFLIKRRKKELGIYMTLGMDRGEISKILMLETFLIGIFALGTGLVAGIFGSQGLSLLTAKIMETSIERFKFIFSMEACLKAVLYFGIIFIVVMLFNSAMISRYKLIDLLEGDKQNEKIPVKKLWVAVLLFCISIVCLTLAYYLIIQNGMLKINLEFWAAISFGSIGTLLFFMSLAGFLLRVIKSNSRIYYRGLNMFILRQLNSKINITYISLSLICLMLLITIGTLSSGMGISKALTGEMDKSSPFDATFSFSNLDSYSADMSMKELLIKEGVPYENLVKEDVEIPLFLGDFLVSHVTNSSETMGVENERVSMIRLSDYNKAREMQGIEPISLNENEYAINCNYAPAKDLFKDTNIITIGVREYIPADLPLQSICYQTAAMLSDPGTIILPDKALLGETPEWIWLNINYKEANEVYEARVQEEVLKINKSKNLPNFYMISRTDVFEQGVGLRTVVTFFVLYIGIIFLITSAAVLALQQLSESSDNLVRYKLLRKIGVEEGLMNRSLFTQIFIYFMMPLSLAVIHSIVGIKVANEVIMAFGKMNVLENIIFAGIFIVIIYGGYFYATYTGSKNMIKQK